MECEKEDQAFSLEGGEYAVDDVAIYPNPVNSQLRIKATSLEDKAVSVRIYSLLGNVVFEQNVSQWSAEGLIIDAQQFPAGTYIVRMESEGIAPVTKEIVVLR